MKSFAISQERRWGECHSWLSAPPLKLLTLACLAASVASAGDLGAVPQPTGRKDSPLLSAGYKAILMKKPCEQFLKEGEGRLLAPGFDLKTVIQAMDSLKNREDLLSLQSMLKPDTTFRQVVKEENLLKHCYNRTAGVETLLLQGEDPNIENQDGLKLIQVAANHGDIELMNLLKSAC